jgi:hypothetical protein
MGYDFRSLGQLIGPEGSGLTPHRCRNNQDEDKCRECAAKNDSIMEFHMVASSIVFLDSVIDGSAISPDDAGVKNLH